MYVLLYSGLLRTVKLFMMPFVLNMFLHKIIKHSIKVSHYGVHCDLIFHLNILYHTEYVYIRVMFHQAPTTCVQHTIPMLYLTVIWYRNSHIHLTMVTAPPLAHKPTNSHTDFRKVK